MNAISPPVGDELARAIEYFTRAEDKTIPQVLTSLDILRFGYQGAEHDERRIKNRLDIGIEDDAELDQLIAEFVTWLVTRAKSKNKEHVLELLQACNDGNSFSINDISSEHGLTPDFFEAATDTPLVRLMLDHECSFIGVYFTPDPTNDFPSLFDDIPDDLFREAAREAHVRLRFRMVAREAANQIDPDDIDALIDDFDSPQWRPYFDRVGLTRTMIQAFQGDEPDLLLLAPITRST